MGHDVFYEEGFELLTSQSWEMIANTNNSYTTGLNIAVNKIDI